MNSLTLATTRNFNGHTLNCYVESNPDEKYDFWATREQIGQFLGYANPRFGIKKIHQRNRERLDQFSAVVKLTNPSKGGSETDLPLRNVQETTVYSFKGLLEICRFSNQPNANKVIDILWDIADEIRRKGYYVHPSAKSDVDKLIEECKALRAENLRLSKIIEENRSFILLGQAVSMVSVALSIHEAAKLLAQHGIDIGPNRLYKMLRQHKFLSKKKGRLWNMPTQKAIEQGYIKLMPVLGGKSYPVIPAKGLQELCNRLTEEIYPMLASMGINEAANA